MLSKTTNARLFHLVLKLYFGCSLVMFIWYGSQLESQLSSQAHSLSKRSLSLRLSISLHEKHDDLNSKNYSNITQSASKGNITNGENDNNPKEDEEKENDLEKATDDRNGDSNNTHTNLKEKSNDENIDVGKNISKREIWLRWRQLIKKQMTLYNHSVVLRTKNAEVFYISAISSRENDKVGSTIREDSGTHNVTINGWKGKQLPSVLFCCFKGNNSTSVSKVFRNNTWGFADITVVKIVQYHCNMSVHLFKGKQIYVGLSEQSSCENVEYIKVEPEHTPPSHNTASFAVCAKIAYGNFSALRLMEWFEINKALGVDNISLFTYNVTKEMMNVLKYYQKEGFLHMKEFDYPLKSRFPRFIGQKYMMAYMDEQVTVFDCIQRFRRYTYVAIIDVDEFIMPKVRQPNYKAMMEKLLVEHKDAAGFTLMTSLFVMDWNKTYGSADFTIGAYTMRTKPIWDRQKNILVTKRVDPTTVWTHGFKGVQPYKRIHLISKSAVIYHYRKCRSQWIETDTCFTKRNKYQDATMKKYLGRIRDKLLEKKKMFLLNFNGQL